MDLYSGPRRDRPETLYSGYASGLVAIIATCTIAAIGFFSIGVPELMHPQGKMDSARLYALLGIACLCTLVALVAGRALKNEWADVSPVYVEFRDKQLRNLWIDDALYFLASDITDSLFQSEQDRSKALTGIGQRKGCRLVQGKVFVSTDALVKYLSPRDDRLSILLLREIRRL